MGLKKDSIRVAYSSFLYIYKNPQREREPLVTGINQLENSCRKTVSIRDNHIFLPCLLVSGFCGAIFRCKQGKRRDNQSHGKETASARGMYVLIPQILLWDSPETPRCPGMLSPGSYTCYTC